MISYGTCKTKSVFSPGGIYTRDVWVINEISKNNAVVQTIGGTSKTDAFNFIQDAINKAMELSAPYTAAKINIILTHGTSGATKYSYHIMKPFADGVAQYTPSLFDNT